MISINNTVYADIAAKVLDVFDCQGDIFNGKIEFDNERFYSDLSCTLIAERFYFEDFNSLCSRIKNIIPVWWEFTTYSRDGEETNDFSWNELKKFIL